MSSTTSSASPTSTVLQDGACPDYTEAVILYQDGRWKGAAITAFLLGAFACVMSFYLILQHWMSYTQPRFQKPITRILLMVPIFALCSFFSFYSLKSSVYLTILSKCYESFVVWSFFQLLLEYLGDGDGARHAILLMIPDTKLPPPLCFKPSSPSSPHFLRHCKAGILQYIVINVTCTIVSVIAEAKGKFCEQSSSPKYVSIYVTIAMGVSVAVAMFTLFAFYLPLHSRFHEIKPSPIMQFISVKFVIFFQFWLNFFIKALIYANVIRGNDTWTAREFGTELQSFLVLCEMGIAALVHNWAFSVETYAPTPEFPALNWRQAVYDTFSYFNIVHDVHQVTVAIERRRTSSRKNSIIPQAVPAMPLNDSTVVEVQPKAMANPDPSASV